MKIIATGDRHLDHRSPRWADNVAMHDWIASYVEAEQPDLVLDGGDFLERVSGSLVQEREVEADYSRRVADVAAFVRVRGNHDGKTEHVIYSKLGAKNPIIVVEDARVVGLNTAAGPVSIACVAWPTLDGTIDDGVAREHLRAVLAGLGADLARRGGVRLGLGHFDTSGATTGPGQPLRGTSLTLGTADIALLGTPVVVMSHIHKAQHWTHGATDLVYCGSPMRHDFGEMEEKSILVIEGDPGALTWRRVKTPARGMVHAEARWDQDGPGWEWISEPAEDQPLAGADVRFRYHVRADLQAVAKAAAKDMVKRILAAGAATCKDEAVVEANVRAKMPEVSTAKGIPAQLEAYWEAKNDVPPPPVKSRLMAKLETAMAAVKR